MSNLKFKRALFAVAITLLGCHALAINKCTAPDGTVAYQQAPCSNADKGGPVEIRVSTPTGSDPKWQNRVNTAIASSKILVGMTASQAQTSWGAPTSINKSISATGASEQWVYRREGGRDQYVYVGNGFVTAVN